MNEMVENTASVLECPAPKELTFVDLAVNWIMTLPAEDADRFVDDIGMDSVLILYKYFPDHPMIKDMLKARI